MNLTSSNLQPNTSNDAKPLASISLDLDNLWSYMKTRGDQGWRKYPSYFELVVPTILDALNSAGLRITFFIVGQDAALENNRGVLRTIAENGHEIANHSFHHEPWLNLYERHRVEREILEAEEAICRATGKKPVGFRGPGFAWSKALLEELAEKDYMYDASLLPTYLGPVARIYYFWRSGLTGKEKEKRNKLYGTLREGFRPVKPYYWKSPSGKKLLEVPVTTVPYIKTPFHLSYLLYLSRFSDFLALTYLKIALSLCKLHHVGPSFLLHPLDFLCAREVPELAFFPGMDVSRERKAAIFGEVIKLISAQYRLVPMHALAEAMVRRGGLRVVAA